MSPKDPIVTPEARGENDRVRIGGLMRCCTETIGDLYPDGPAQVAIEGQQLSCKYNPKMQNHRMIFHDGAWEWDHE